MYADFFKCLENNDIEGIIKNASAFDDKSVLLWVWKKIDTYNDNIVDVLLGMKNTKNIDNNHIVNIFSKCIQSNNIKLITKLVNNGIHMHNINLLNILFSNNKELINYIISLNIDLQKLFDNCRFGVKDLYDVETWFVNNDYDDILNNKIQHIDISHVITDISVENLKTIVDYGVNILHKINDIMIYSIHEGNCLLVSYCYDMGANNIDVALKVACNLKKHDIIKFLLGKGANMHLVIDKDLKQISYDIFMLLNDYEYNFSTLMLNKIFTNIFIFENDIDKIHKVFSYVNTFDHFFEKENNLSERHWCSSYLECIVYEAHIDKIKMVEKYAYDNFKLCINKLFICAMGNGNIDIGNYLLDCGINVDYKVAAKVACFGNHMKSLQFIMKHFGDDCIDDDLYMAYAYGSVDMTDYIRQLNTELKYMNFRYEVNGESVTDYLISCNILMPPNFIGILNSIEYTIKIFEHLLLNHDVNLLLGYCIKYNNLKITKYLLDNGGMYNIEKIKNKDMIALVKKYL